MSENVQLALLMIEKNKKLAMIRNEKYQLGMLPVQVADLFGHRKMVNYLYTITREELKNEDRIALLITLIINDLYSKHLFQFIRLIFVLPDVALLMVEAHPELAHFRVKEDQNEIGETALHALAKKPLTFNDHFDNSKLGIWKRCCCHR
ncbi:hypothetical protein JRO89_XSUnG0011300 [Xanthoceras sorbifolium]|uniref:Uncharacterized protein n=1 Tax=Xanthoceras sorbifolium TaxID=99658 RepID=A0ABQ8H0E5_9ROSI|nr:hypothetical protein JRO89_XSUnG0011300 [Xanthoceras sorbifolium]